jgi:UDP-galactose transporter B1
LLTGLVAASLTLHVPPAPRYGAEQERFTHIVFLNLAQSAVCLCWAGLWLLLRPPAKDSASCLLFWKAAISNTLGPAFGVRALKNIRRANTRAYGHFYCGARLTAARHASYTAQVLAKSCKLIPVMVVGTVLYGKRYAVTEYLAALLIAGARPRFAAAASSRHQADDSSCKQVALRSLRLRKAPGRC